MAAKSEPSHTLLNSFSRINAVLEIKVRAILLILKMKNISLHFFFFSYALSNHSVTCLSKHTFYLLISVDE